MNIDNSIKKMLGKKKFKNSMPKMNVFKSFKLPNFKRKGDWDFDGIPNRRDCQPFNPLRQDKRYMSKRRPQHQIESFFESNYPKVNRKLVKGEMDDETLMRMLAMKKKKREREEKEIYEQEQADIINKRFPVDKPYDDNDGDGIINAEDCEPNNPDKQDTYMNMKFKSLNVFKKFNLKKFGGKNDLDFDGVINKRDCQPRNTMRQDIFISKKPIAHKPEIHKDLFLQGRKPVLLIGEQDLGFSGVDDLRNYPYFVLPGSEIHTEDNTGNIIKIYKYKEYIFYHPYAKQQALNLYNRLNPVYKKDYKRQVGEKYNFKKYGMEYHIKTGLDFGYNTEEVKKFIMKQPEFKEASNEQKKQWFEIIDKYGNDRKTL